MALTTSRRGVRDIESRYRPLGFPGCAGLVDRAGRTWDNYPIGWQGLYRDKDGELTKRIEVARDDSLKIWHFIFGTPGSKNYKTVQEHSTFFVDVCNGSWPPYRAHKSVSGNSLRCLYYLVDWISPRYTFFALPLSDPQKKKENLYSLHHGSARMAIKRVFGVLFQQFKVLLYDRRLKDLTYLENLAKWCVFVHNIVADKRVY